MVSMLCIYVLSTFSVVYREKKNEKKDFCSSFSCNAHIFNIFVNISLFSDIRFSIEKFLFLERTYKTHKKNNKKRPKTENEEH